MAFRQSFRLPEFALSSNTVSEIDGAPSMLDHNKWAALNDEIIACRKCPRLVEWREQVAVTKKRAYRDWNYWAKPVPGFGDPKARVLVIGLAPGAHGSNRTGRMFTGDASGIFLFSALYKAGFANQSQSTRVGDGLALRDIFITAVCRCAPPDNKPLPSEILNCRPYLTTEIDLLSGVQVVVALGQLAFHQTLTIYRARGFDIPTFQFAHGALYRLGPDLPWLLASYHPSQQNTQTGRLTVEMFAAIWRQADGLLT